MYRRLFLLLLLVIGVAWSGGDDDEALPPDPVLIAAEHERLSGDMEQLAARQAWSGLEQKFVELEALGVEPSYQDLVNGAYAARAMGDASAVYDRLRRGAPRRPPPPAPPPGAAAGGAAAPPRGPPGGGPSQEVTGWMASIDTSYGRVVLTTAPPRPVVLVPAVVPFAPDRRAAVDFAVARLGEVGRFEGLLPAGTYDLCGTELIVESGIALNIEVSTKRKRSSGRDGDGQEDQLSETDKDRGKDKERGRERNRGEDDEPVASDAPEVPTEASPPPSERLPPGPANPRDTGGPS